MAMDARIITGLFDSRAEAERAAEALAAMGVDRDRVRLHAADADTTDTAAGHRHEDSGFLASLRDMFVPHEDHHTYAEGIRRGGYLISAEVDASRCDQAMDVMEQHGAVDLDAREAEWRRSGWAGYGGGDAAGAASTDGTMTGASATGAPPAGTPAMGASTLGTSATGAGTTTAGMTGNTTAASSTAAGTGQEETIPIVEEQLRVGKREARTGRVRVRSYIVETPVEQQVTLHDEHVDIERRAVNRPVTEGEHLFEERSIEATETSEEVVVGKEARVTEELVLRKEAGQHTETVRDTVRHTEVEVDDDRRTGGVGTGGTTVDPERSPDRGA